MFLKGRLLLKNKRDANTGFEPAISIFKTDFQPYEVSIYYCIKQPKCFFPGSEHLVKLSCRITYYLFYIIIVMSYTIIFNYFGYYFLNFLTLICPTDLSLLQQTLLPFLSNHTLYLYDKHTLESKYYHTLQFEYRIRLLQG